MDGLHLNLLGYLVASTMIGGVLTLLILSYRKSPLADLTGRNMFLRHFADRKAGIPYGLALGLGGLMTYPDSPLCSVGDRADSLALIRRLRGTHRFAAYRLHQFR